MGNGQSTSSGTKTLAKVARGDARAAQQVKFVMLWLIQIDCRSSDNPCLRVVGPAIQNIVRL